MKARALGLCALLTGGVALAGCSQTAGLPHFQYTPNGKSMRHRRPRAARYRVLYRFGARPDGSVPFAGVLDLGGTLYGTTASGGAHGRSNGGGTVFSLTTGGMEKVLHSFGKGTDGRHSYADLIDLKGTLYGTTYGGGIYDRFGTVFSITTGGREKVLHSFGNGTDGRVPAAGLTDVNGTLYGTTESGGAYDLGTVFSITTAGSERVLYSFNDASNDGYYPRAGLVDVGGTLYGTTYEGGRHGYGTVFSITTAGSENVLHSFGNGRDGTFAEAGLTSVKGTLYGTTSAGGTYDYGTVFAITTGGREEVLHSFGPPPDGETPIASLVNVNGRLYGTTRGGGTQAKHFRYIPAGGTIFSITTTGTERVLHSFGKGTDGRDPSADLTHVNGSLFGTTAFGGTSYAHPESGYGTVFEFAI